MSRFPLLILMILLTSCAGEGSRSSSPPVAGRPGEPVPGLTSGELERFRQGELLFNKVFTPEEGVGPAFNENQCSACHTDPAPGGTGDQFVTRATHWSPGDGCDLLKKSGGENVRSRVTPLLAARGIDRESIPEQATEVGEFVVPYLFGLGLAEALPEQMLSALADPDDANGDGISGRLPRTPDGRVGLFGRKGDFATLADFSAGAFFQEMGITSPRYPGPETFNGAPLPPGTDPAEDPEVSQQEVDLVTDFVRFLAPLAQRLPQNPQEREQVQRGEQLFGESGCTACHVPLLVTGTHPVEALSRKAVAFYSDFLLHDLGDEVSGVCGPDAGPTEHRTGILMGVGLRNLYLHSGDATSLEEAILRHGGEAGEARTAFQGLSELDRYYLIRFLNSL
jgi:CxxC motif-containing protein (DUF1111 family)